MSDREKKRSPVVSGSGRKRSGSSRSLDGEGHTAVENKSIVLYEGTIASGVKTGSKSVSTRSRGYSAMMNQSFAATHSGEEGDLGGYSSSDAQATVGKSDRQINSNTPPNTEPYYNREANGMVGATGMLTEDEMKHAGLPPAPPVPTAAPGVLGTLLGYQGERPHNLKLIASFVAGFVLLSIATAGLRIWHNAEWFHDPGPYAGNSWAGYNAQHYVGLLMFFLCSTMGFSLFYVPLTVASRYRSSQLALVLLASFAALCMVVAIVAMATWAHPMMHCMGIFCVGPKGKWAHVEYSRPSSGLGFLVVLGSSAFFSLLPLSIVIFYQFYERLFRPLRYGSADWLGGRYRDMHQMARVKNKSRLLVALMVTAFLITLFIGTMFIPNSWEYFTAEQVAGNGRIQQVMDFGKCSDDYNSFTCGELPWATFKTTNSHVSENLYLKWYPANVFYYAYMLIVLFFIVGLRTVKPGRLFLKREVNFKIVSFTFGELIVGFATVVMVFLFSWYWFHDHNFNGSYSRKTPNETGLAESEHTARAFGQVAVLMLSLLLFPASRNSVIHRLFGTSWEASLWAHKVLGWGMIATTIAHVVAWYVKYHQKGIFPKAVFSVPTALPESIDNFTVPVVTVAVIVLLITTIFLTYDGIRRGKFELFYYPHLFAAYLIIPATLWHAAAGWEYMLPGVTVWFVDRLIRMYRSGSEVLVTEVRTHEDVTEIRFQCPNMKAKAGQYVFLNIPELSLFEWHPFTLSSGVGSNYFSVHIKAMYDGSWTARLLQLMEKAAALDNPMETAITLAVDGPYGHAFEYEDYDRVVLVAGGIGVTPVASIYQTLHRELPQCEVLALWSTRTVASIEAFKDQFEAPAFNPYAHNGQAKKAKIFLTKAGEGDRKMAKGLGLRDVSIELGRPELLSEAMMSESGLPSTCNTLLFVCGPLPLVEDAREVARELGYHFHAETFFL